MQLFPETNFSKTELPVNTPFQRLVASFQRNIIYPHSPIHDRLKNKLQLPFFKDVAIDRKVIDEMSTKEENVSISQEKRNISAPRVPK